MMPNAEDMLVSVMRRDKAKKPDPRPGKQATASISARREARNLRARLRQVLVDVKIGRHPGDLADAVEDAIFMADNLYRELKGQPNA